MSAFTTYRSPTPSSSQHAALADSDEDEDERMSSYSYGSGDMMSVEYDSDADRAPSLYSWSSSREGLMLREMYGRSVNSQNELYALPADAEESTRITTQHAMLRLLLSSSLYLPTALVKRVLSPFPLPLPSHPFSAAEQPRQRAVLDLGTGSGVWAEEMAREFPHAEVVGVDLAPQFKRGGDLPANCRFELDDVTLGLSHYRHTFDLVHSRSIANGIPSYPTYILDALLTLRPGGALLLAEGDLQLVSFLDPPERGPTGEAEPHRVSPEKSPMQRLLWEAYNTLKSKGSSVDAGRLFPSALRALQARGLVRNIGYERVYAPIGTWVQGSDAPSQHLRQIGALMLRDSMAFVRALRPLLLSEGYPAESLDRMIEDTDRELMGGAQSGWGPEGRRGLCTVWHYAWCEKVKD